MSHQADKASAAADDMVVMGYVAAPFGIKGWLKIKASTEYPDSLLDYDAWYIHRHGQWQKVELEEGALHSACLVVKLAGCDDRDAAFALRGSQIAIARADLPEADDDEFYWADLIGCEVFNLLGERLGVIDHLLETGANDILQVKDAGQTRLIPFVSAIVLEVDIQGKRVVVDWGVDY